MYLPSTFPDSSIVFPCRLEAEYLQDCIDGASYALDVPGFTQ
jgi:hypothetical protein